MFNNWHKNRAAALLQQCVHILLSPASQHFSRYEVTLFSRSIVFAPFTASHNFMFPLFWTEWTKPRTGMNSSALPLTNHILWDGLWTAKLTLAIEFRLYLSLCYIHGSFACPGIWLNCFPLSSNFPLISIHTFVNIEMAKPIWIIVAEIYIFIDLQEIFFLGACAAARFC